MEEGAHISAMSRIPKPIVDQCGVQEGSALEMFPHGRQIVPRRKSYKLTDMLAQVTLDNIHSEWDMGEVRGREEW